MNADQQERPGSQIHRHLTIFQPESPFSLSVSAAPAQWGGTASPHHTVMGQAYVAIEQLEGRTVLLHVEEHDGREVSVRATRSMDAAAWFARAFRHTSMIEEISDPVIQRLAQRYVGLYALTDGSLFNGLVTSIIGQSISIASAMAAQRRLALCFHEGLEMNGRRMVPLPAAADLAESSPALIRSSGVTWRRAEALNVIAREEVNGNLPTSDTNYEIAERDLRRLPIVGPWTAASALLWGAGAPDAFPLGDVALLRAARQVYQQPAMTMKELTVLSDGWRPHRATATRLLWTALLGPAWP